MDGYFLSGLCPQSPVHRMRGDGLWLRQRAAIFAEMRHKVQVPHFSDKGVYA